MKLDEQPRTRLLSWAGETFELFPERAVLWRDRATLIVADVHFGKAASFRSAGVPVPAGTTAANLARLTDLLDRTAAERLVVLGDLLHCRTARADATMDAIAAWRARLAGLAITLVRGNHDVRAGDPPDAWAMTVVDEPYADGPLTLRHDPDGADPLTPTLAGHVHPAVRLRGRDGSGRRFPAFVFGPALGLLPAFGAFTGTHVVTCRDGDRVYVLVDGEIVKVA